MAANMFVVNEVKAMNTSDEGDTYQSDMGHATNDTEKKTVFSAFLIRLPGLFFTWRILLTLLEDWFPLVLTTISNGGIIIQGDIRNLDVLVGDLIGS